MDINFVQGSKALKMTGRTLTSDVPLQRVLLGCIDEGQWFLASARVRLENSDGSFFVCDVSRSTGTSACPRMTLRAVANLRQSSQNRWS
jgi:hypothetical protein